MLGKFYGMSQDDRPHVAALGGTLLLVSVISLISIVLGAIVGLAYTIFWLGENANIWLAIASTPFIIYLMLYLLALAAKRKNKVRRD